MPVLTTLDDYADEHGNKIVARGATAAEVVINFRGRNNRLVLDRGTALGTLRLDYNCDNGSVEIGPSRGVPRLSAAIRVGQESRVRIGENVSCTTIVGMSAVEGTTITVGNDVMFASENQVRTDDGHPIFDVRTGKRVNVSKSITTGHHVWLGRFATLLGGAAVGDGSVVGYGSVLTKKVPNNCVAVGVPARVVRRDVAWERPHLSLVEPYYKPDASTVPHSDFWNLTVEPPPPPTLAQRRRAKVRRRLRRSPFGRAVAPAVRAARRLRRRG